MKGIKRKSMTFRSFYENFKSLDSQSDFKEPEKIESQVFCSIQGWYHCKPSTLVLENNYL